MSQNNSRYVEKFAAVYCGVWNRYDVRCGCLGGGDFVCVVILCKVRDMFCVFWVAVPFKNCRNAAIQSHLRTVGVHGLMKEDFTFIFIVDSWFFTVLTAWGNVEFYRRLKRSRLFPIMQIELRCVFRCWESLFLLHVWRNQLGIWESSSHLVH